MQSAKTVALFWGNGIGKTMKRKFQYQTRLSLLHWRFCCISSKSQDLQCHQASACKSAARLYKINDHIQLSETFSLTQLRHPGHWQEEDTCGGSVVNNWQRKISIVTHVQLKPCHTEWQTLHSGHSVVQIQITI